MREKQIELVRIVSIPIAEREFYFTFTIPINRLTKNRKISIPEKHKDYVSKKVYNQGINFSDVLNFSFRECSSEEKNKFEMYCFIEQVHVAKKLFKRRMNKVAKKEEKRNENQKCSD